MEGMVSLFSKETKMETRIMFLNFEAEAVVVEAEVLMNQLLTLHVL